MNYSLYILVSLSLLSLIFIPNMIVADSEERTCKDLVTENTWRSEDHDDNKESEKEFERSVENDSLCETTEKHDKEELTGEIDDWTDFKETQNYKTADNDQKECMKQFFELPDNGKPALQGYELEYCGWGDHKGHDDHVGNKD